MSNFHSDKCSKEELKKFKTEVITWLEERFDISQLRIKALTCYNGDIRIYTGYNYFPNQKSSFRRERPEKDENGNIIGWQGTRGIHTTRYAEYISINRDEFSNIKNAYNNPRNDNYDFYEDLIFRKLRNK